MDKSIVRTSKLYIFIAWPIAGVIGLFYALSAYDELGAAKAWGLGVVSLFVLIYGIWALKRAWQAK